MLPIHFLKRYFPNTPDWILGGLLLVGILWLLVLPMQLIGILINQDLLTNYVGWFLTSLYFWGYLLVMLIISPFSYNAPNQITILLLSLLFVSPIYFVIGALLATRKAVTITLGILLAAVILVSGISATFLLVKFGLSG